MNVPEGAAVVRHLSVALLILQHFILISIPFYIFGTADTVMYVVTCFPVDLSALFGGGGYLAEIF